MYNFVKMNAIEVKVWSAGLYWHKRGNNLLILSRECGENISVSTVVPQMIFVHFSWIITFYFRYSLHSNCATENIFSGLYKWNNFTFQLKYFSPLLTVLLFRF